MRRTSTSLLSALIVVAAAAFSVYPQSPQAPAGPTPVPTPSQSAPQPSPPGSPQTSPQTPQQVPPIVTQPPVPQPVTPHLSVVVLDPAHGGADQGARGSWGITESDVVLSFARLMRISLEGQGLRVILTRQANDDPSFDDRSKLANAQRGVIFVTLHVSSTGQPGTVRVYSLPPEGATGSSSRAGLLRWDRAQTGFVDMSRRLAELIQIQMAQNFHGSPEIPPTAPLRQLRTVAAPAVAVEISSVSQPDRKPLDQMGPALADGVARAVAAYRTVYESGGK